MIQRYVANPVEVQAARFDGTRESIEEFMRDSYAFGGPPVPDPDHPGKMIVRVYCGGVERTANEGYWIVRQANPPGYFGVYDPYEFARLFSPKEAT